MAFPGTPLQRTIELQISGAWIDITNDVYLRDTLTITGGQADEGAQADFTRCPLTLNNRHGRYSPRNPSSPYYGLLGRNTPVRISVTTPAGTLSHRFTGEISAWPSRWDLSGNDVYVSVEAAGIMRRLAQGARRLADPMRRFIEARTPLSYWPLNDGETAREGLPTIGAARPLRALGDEGQYYQNQPGWGKGQLAGWLDPGVDFAVGTGAHLNGRASMSASRTWSVDYVLSGTGALHLLGLWDIGAGDTDDPRAVLTMTRNANPSSYDFTMFIGSTGAPDNQVGNVVNPRAFDKLPHHLRFSVAPLGGGSVDWAFWLDGVEVASGSDATVFRPLGVVEMAFSMAEATTYQVQNIALGHIVHWGEDAPPAADAYRALCGYDGEPAGRRIERLCAEEGVPLQITGDLDATPAMGPQRPGTLLEILRDAATVDGGILHEARDELALAYRTRTSLYNQGV